MNAAARHWFRTRTHAAGDFDLAELARRKAITGDRVSVVIPARNEGATVAAVVDQIRRALVGAGLVDELVVIDSDSTDDTAAQARSAGATVYAASSIDTGTPAQPGKGEALWKSLFVTTGDLLVFIDADLTEWGPHFVTGLLGPLLTIENVQLVKGFYDRLADELDAMAAAGSPVPQGGRVTELCARPLLNLYWPQLSALVQPLAGEWAVRRSLIDTLPIPVGYGVEFATVTDTWQRYGLDAIAQVDLGRRGHRHQNVHDLGVMAAEILATAMRRAPGGGSVPDLPQAHLQQYTRGPGQAGRWVSRPVPTLERAPARTNPRYRSPDDTTGARCSS